jgi:hypothetical protein
MNTARTEPWSSRDTLTVTLDRLAHGRSGDKGNRSNISVIAWREEFWPVLLARVTEERVAQLFVTRQPTRVQRYELPLLHAMNFVLDDMLDGGVNSALNLDSHGKSLSYWLLSLTVEVPRVWAPWLVGPD